MLESLPVDRRTLFLKSLNHDEAQFFRDFWPFWAREEQLAPEGNWRIWLFLGGRGAGKTRAGAEWIAEGIREGRMRRVALLAATYADARQVMIEGESGLKRVIPGATFEPSNRRAGLSVFVIDESVLVVYDGATWVDYAAIMVLQNVPLVGVNTSADATNKFAVKSSAVLFDNVGNGVQAKINKAASADSASLLYQKGYSGRAEIGLTGDDDFHFKVSPDGSTWYGALNIVRSNGNIYVNTASALESTSYPTTGTPQLQVKGHSVFGTSSSYPVRIHGDGYVGIEMSPNDSGGFSFNGYFNGTNVVYRSSSYAWRARFTSGGAYVEQYAASGTAGAAITFSTGRILTNAGHTLLNTSTDNGVLTVGGDVMPEADNTRSVGSSSFRFANGFFGGYVRTGSYVVSALPSAGTVGAGARAFVTDATATTFASTVAGGGANKVPVVSDGTNWIVG